MVHLDVAQFAIYRSQTTYDELMKTMKEFAAGRDAFKAAKTAADSVEPGAPKRVLLSSDVDPRQDKLENKVDGLTNELAELYLMMKKRQTPGDSDTSWTCSYCKEPGHSAICCRFNPHRDTRCPTCGKIGHTTETCWSRLTRKNVAHARQGNAGAESVYGRRPGVSAKDTRGQVNRDWKQATVITESIKGELVAATKRNAERETLPKQLKNREEVSIPRLLNRTPIAPKGTLSWNEPLRVPSVKPARPKKKNVSRMAAHQEHVGKYNACQSWRMHRLV